MSMSIAPKELMFSLCAGGDVGEHLVVETAALAAHLLDFDTVILCGTVDYGVGGRGQVPCCSAWASRWRARIIPLQGDTVGVSRVLGDRQIRCIADDFIENIVSLPFGGHDDPCAVGRMLISDMGIYRQAIFGEVVAQGSGGEGLAAGWEPLPVRGGQGAGTTHRGRRRESVDYLGAVHNWYTSGQYSRTS